MHELVREWSARGGSGLRLARLPLDEGALVAAFVPARGGSRLHWLAKTAYGEAACRRLRAEQAALARLAPVAERLNIPRLLAWSEIGADEASEACLLQTAVDGEPMHCRWNGHGAGSALAPALAATGDWLRRFQALSREQPELHPGLSLAEWTGQTRTRLATATGEAARLLGPLLPLAAEAAAPIPCVPVHGDFWTGNMVWTPGRGKGAGVGVVDWSGLRHGSALDDLLTWMASLVCGRRGHRRTRLEAWKLLWFTGGQPRQYLRAWVAEAGYPAATARGAFYLFLARRLAWELGLDLQARNGAERECSQAEWSEALDWLQLHSFPDPFTSAPF